MTRKELVKRLGEHLGVKPKYLSVPSFNYQITTADKIYIIDRHGVITTSDGCEVSMEEILNAPPTGVAVGEEETTEETSVEPKQGPDPEVRETLRNDETQIFDNLEVKFPLEGHTALSLKNLVNMLYSKQNLLMLAFRTEVPFMDDTFAENLSKEKINTLEEFKDIASGLGKDRCKGLEIDSVENTIVFRLSRVSLVPELIKAFSEFTALINALAKTLKRTSFKQTQEENPKYALRTWLIRLGMNGEKYKDTRKLMLGHLNGSSAFRTVIEDE